MSISSQFRLDNRVAIITGGAGLLGRQHATALTEAGARVVLWDINAQPLDEACHQVTAAYGTEAMGQQVDITDPEAVEDALDVVLRRFGRIDILINNAACDPKVEPGGDLAWARLENLPLDLWQRDLAVGLTGAMLCSRAVGTRMAVAGGGVILNVASDLGLIAPDQRIYRQAGLEEGCQPVKPVTYSVVKHGLIGLTKYLATYWADKNVRVNAISPGGVYTNQPEEFLGKLTALIPMGRMARTDEYKAAVLFLVSDASSYMTGANLVIDGGRTCW